MSKFCSNCGNELADQAVICPKCGVSTGQNAVAGNNNNTSNGMATAGFVLSFFVPLLGLIFSILGLKKVKETSAGKGLATAGIIISSIALFIILISVIIFSVAYNEAIDESNYSDGYYYNYYD